MGGRRGVLHLSLILEGLKAFLRKAERSTWDLVISEWLRDRCLCRLPQCGGGDDSVEPGSKCGSPPASSLRDGGVREILTSSMSLRHLLGLLPSEG